MVVEESFLGLEKCISGKQSLELLEISVGLWRCLVEFLTAVCVEDQGHEIFGQTVDNLF